LRRAEPVADHGREAGDQRTDAYVDEVLVVRLCPRGHARQQQEKRSGEQNGDDDRDRNGRPLDGVAAPDQVELQGARSGRLLQRRLHLRLLLIELLLAQLLVVLELRAQQVEGVLALLLFRRDPRRAFGGFPVVLQLGFLERDLGQLDAEGGGDGRVFLDLFLGGLRVGRPRRRAYGFSNRVGDLAGSVSCNDLDEVRNDGRRNTNLWQHRSTPSGSVLLAS